MMSKHPHIAFDTPSFGSLYNLLMHKHHSIYDSAVIEHAVAVLCFVVLSRLTTFCLYMYRIMRSQCVRISLYLLD